RASPRSPATRPSTSDCASAGSPASGWDSTTPTTCRSTCPVGRAATGRTSTCARSLPSPQPDGCDPQARQRWTQPGPTAAGLRLPVRSRRLVHVDGRYAEAGARDQAQRGFAGRVALPVHDVGRHVHEVTRLRVDVPLHALALEAQHSPDDVEPGLVAV